MTLFSANRNTIPNAAMKHALIRNRLDRYKIQLQKEYILEKRNCSIGESWSYDLDVKWTHSCWDIMLQTGFSMADPHI